MKCGTLLPRALLVVALTQALALAACADVLVSSSGTDNVLAYDDSTGAFKKVFASDPGLKQPHGLAFGPDGHLYVASSDESDPSFPYYSVQRFDRTTGELLDEFVAAGDGGLSSPNGLAFGPDGNLYVASSLTNSVLKYSGETGEFLASLPLPALPPLSTTFPIGVTFGPDGRLYVTSLLGNRVLRHNGVAFEAFVAAGSGGLNGPTGLTFGPDGHLYVSSFNSHNVLRYNGSTGAYLSTFISAGSGTLNGPWGLTFGPDGRLYVASAGNSKVLRYDGATGAIVGVFATGGGLSGPAFLVFTKKTNFLCYKVRASKGSPRFQTIPEVFLTDQFEETVVNLTAVNALCNPADAAGEGIPDAAAHLKDYRPVGNKDWESPKHTPRLNLTVRNRFGEIMIDTVRPDGVMVPSATSLAGPVDPLDTFEHAIDSQICYTVKLSRQANRFTTISRVPVLDEFNRPRLLDIRKPTRLCNPADRDFNGIVNPDLHLMCYQVSPSAGQARFVATTGINVNNDYGPDILDTSGEDELCVESTLATPAP